MNNYVEDQKVRSSSLMGRAAYEASLKACPRYQNGDIRPTWDELDETRKWSWSHPTQRP